MQLGLAEAGKDEVAGAECRGGCRCCCCMQGAKVAVDAGGAPCSRCNGGWQLLQGRVAAAAREGGSRCKGGWLQVQGRVAEGAGEGGCRCKGGWLQEKFSLHLVVSTP